MPRANEVREGRLEIYPFFDGLCGFVCCASAGALALGLCHSMSATIVSKNRRLSGTVRYERGRAQFKLSKWGC